MTFNIHLHDKTQQRLGRILLSDRRTKTTVVTTERTYCDVKVENGGFRAPGFSKQALIVVMIEKSKLREHEELHRTIRELTPYLSSTNRIFVVEHLDDGGSPNMVLAKQDKMWHREAYRLWHISRMEYNLRHYDADQLMSIVMDVMMSSWPLGGDDSVLGRRLQLDNSGRQGRPMNG